MFSEAKARRVTMFIEGLKHTKGEFHGQPFKLLPWQSDLIPNNATVKTGIPLSSASPSFGPMPLTAVTSRNAFRSSSSANPYSRCASSRTTCSVSSRNRDPSAGSRSRRRCRLRAQL